MYYTLNHGMELDAMDKTQRGLLMGLPVMVTALAIGAFVGISGHAPTTNSPKVIPIVSTLEAPGKGGSKPSSKPTSKDSSSKSPTTAPSQVSPMANGSLAPQSGAALLSTSGAATAPIIESATATTGTPTTGGSGGGPTGGTLPLNYTLTVPPTSVQVGDKPLVSSDGTSLKLN